MTSPIIDPEHGLWLCPEDGTALYLTQHHTEPMTYDCPACARVWDAVPTERSRS